MAAAVISGGSPEEEKSPDRGVSDRDADGASSSTADANGASSSTARACCTGSDDSIPSQSWLPHVVWTPLLENVLRIEAWLGPWGNSQKPQCDAASDGESLLQSILSTSRSTGRGSDTACDSHLALEVGGAPPSARTPAPQHKRDPSCASTSPPPATLQTPPPRSRCRAGSGSTPCKVPSSRLHKTPQRRTALHKTPQKKDGSIFPEPLVATKSQCAGGEPDADLGPQVFDMADLDEDEEVDSLIWKSHFIPTPRSPRPSPRSGGAERFNLAALDEDGDEEQAFVFEKFSCGAPAVLSATPTPVSGAAGWQGARWPPSAVGRHAGA